MKPPTKDYYKILGVPEDAEPAVIKKAYRGLAVEFHPDRNPDNPEAEEKFKDITEAYGVLMDPKKRREFDVFRKTSGARGAEGPGFDYSQQEIFENMFRQGFGRDAFNDLNRAFRQQGYRSGTPFFDTLLFSGVGAMGTLGRLLSMVPGPIGRIGLGLRVLQGLGASLYTFNKMRKAGSDAPAKETKPEARSSSPSLLENVKQFLNPSATGPNPMDLHFEIILPPHEALMGTQKQVSYQVNGMQEKLMIRIPPRFASGQKLRIREKGKRIRGRRGDLIVTVKVAAES